MKITRYIILLFVVFSCLCSFGQVQKNETRIKGSIFNPEKTPAMFSTTILLNHDSVIMKGVLTGEDGLFIFDNIAPGTYLVKISNIEFKTYVSKPIQIKKNETLVLDSIILVSNAFILKTV